MQVASLISSSSACWLLALAWWIFVPRPCHAFSTYQWINSHLCGWRDPDREGWVLLFTCYAAPWQKVTLLIRGWINQIASCDYWSHSVWFILDVTESGFSSFCLVPALHPVMIFKVTVLTLCPRLKSVFFVFLFLNPSCLCLVQTPVSCVFGTGNSDCNKWLRQNCDTHRDESIWK